MIVTISAPKKNLFYRSVFRIKPVMFTTYTHKLNLQDDQLFYVKPYLILINFKNKVRAEVKKMLKLNMVWHSTSPYTNPVAVVSKSDSSVRPCLDAQTKIIKRLQSNIKCLSDLRKSKIFLNNPQTDV